MGQIQDRKVVVKVSLKVMVRDDGGMYVARLPELGLTAYGRTENQAILAVKRLFNRFITKYREIGLLEKRLNQVGVEWHWLDKYERTGALYEDTSSVAGMPETKLRESKWIATENSNGLEALALPLPLAA